ncbi:MAG: exodeoxyribonuclease VII large subunit [Planctomycetota bacterium]
MQRRSSRRSAARPDATPSLFDLPAEPSAPGGGGGGVSDLRRRDSRLARAGAPAETPGAAADAPEEPTRRAEDNAPKEKPAEAPPLTVTELTREISARMQGLGRVRVEGEVSDLRTPNSGHLYFQLKDDAARVSCVVWRSQTGRLKFRPREGDQVIAHGRLDVYAPRGSYSLVVERLEPLGIGALLARLEQLKAELRELGWFDRRRPLPREPRLVGVVTSRDGAALRDLLRTRSLRWPGYPVRLAHTPVQGPGSAAEIARAIDRLGSSPGVDVVIVCRGGGSLEDLWAFNERAVAEAIRRCPVPVVSGVGHETDTTLSDLVADARAHTPTDAAQLVIPDRAALRDRLTSAGARLSGAVARLLRARGERLAELGERRVLREPTWIVADRERALAAFLSRARRAVHARARAADGRLSAAHVRLERRSPRAAIEGWESRLGAAGARLERAAERRVEAAGARLAVLARGLEATSPLAVLGRGYSLTLRADSSDPLTDAGHVVPGDELVTRLARGVLRSRVEAVETGKPTEREGEKLE